MQAKVGGLTTTTAGPAPRAKEGRAERTGQPQERPGGDNEAGHGLEEGKDAGEGEEG